MAYEHTRDTHLWDDVCNLCLPIKEVDEDQQHKIVGWKKREVFCRVGSLYGKEYFQGYQIGIQGAWKIVINFEDWIEDQELMIEYRGKMYSVYRSFINGDNIELSVETKKGPWTGTAINV